MKIGDRVKVVRRLPGPERQGAGVGLTGEVKGFTGAVGACVDVVLDNGQLGWFDESELEPA